MKDISEKFIDYICRKLSAEEERQLFTEMSYNDDVREEFNSYLAIDKTMKKTCGTMIPPNNVTNEIFAAIGINIPTQIGQTQTFGKISFYKSKLFIGAASSLLAVIITLLIIPLIYRPEKNVTAKIGTNNKIKEIKTNEVLSESIKKFKNNKIITNTYIKEKSVNNSDIMSDYDNSNFVSLSLAAKPEIYKPVFQDYLPRNIQFPLNNSDLPPEKEQMETDNSLGILFQVYCGVILNLPDNKTFDKAWDMYHNAGISVMYKPVNNFSFGLDLRQEVYYVKYDEYDLKHELNIKLEKEPSITSYGILSRYNILNISNFVPYIQVFLGGSKYGFIARGETGFEYCLVKDFSITGSVESSSLFFNHNDRTFNSTKYSTNFGFMYKY